MLKFKIPKTGYKKYTAVFPDGEEVSFGDIRYQQYRDTTPLRAYSHMDHLDPQRRKSYLARHKKIKDKSGKFAYKNPRSASALSIKYLW